MLSDGTASWEIIASCDDRSDDGIVSPHVAEKFELEGIGRVKATKPVMVQVTLRQGE